MDLIMWSRYLILDHPANTGLWRTKEPVALIDGSNYRHSNLTGLEGEVYSDITSMNQWCLWNTLLASTTLMLILMSFCTLLLYLIKNASTELIWTLKRRSVIPHRWSFAVNFEARCSRHNAEITSGNDCARVRSHQTNTWLLSVLQADATRPKERREKTTTIKLLMKLNLNNCYFFAILNKQNFNILNSNIN